MTQIDAPWLKSDASKRICNAFQSRGYQIYFVGGCVRNQLMGRGVTDLDLATDADPQQMLKLAKGEGVKAIPTGLEHGTITFVVNGEPYEITAFRNDVETDGRRATVAFSKDLNDDAKRRDFTMNALYAQPDGQVLDPVEGLKDLKSGIIRFIGNADARIREDYLRILRFFRFFAWYADPNEGVEADGLAACAEYVDQLPALSKERITAEILKLLSAPNPSMAVASMDSIGVLSHIMPGSTAASLPVFIHLEEKLDLPIDPIARLSALGGEPETYLRLSKSQQKRLSAYGTQYETAQEAGYHLRDLGLHNLAVNSAKMSSDIDSKKAKNVKLGAEAVFPVSAKDLMESYSGKALGDRLKTLEQRWIASNFELTKDQLLD